MRRIWRNSTLNLGVLTVGLAIALGMSMVVEPVWAQAPSPSSDENPTLKIRAKVTSLMKNDHDDIDGLQLDNGERVHFPPHMGAKILAIVKVGDQVELEGRREIKPSGESVFEVRQLTAGTESVRMSHPRPQHPKAKMDDRPKAKKDAGPRAKQAEKQVSAKGVIAGFARNPHGDVDGLILKDRTVAKFPPHRSSDLQKLLQIGDDVTINGRRHVNQQGEVHLHADLIQAHGDSIEIDGTDQGPKPPKTQAKPADSNETIHAEILAELREIRKLLGTLRQ